MMNDNEGTMTWPDGTKYVGGYVDGKQEGHGTYTAEDGGTYEGEWLNDT